MFLHGDVWFVEVRQSWFGVLGSVGARCVDARWGMAVMACNVTLWCALVSQVGSGHGSLGLASLVEVLLVMDRLVEVGQSRQDQVRQGMFCCGGVRFGSQVGAWLCIVCWGESRRGMAVKAVRGMFG